MIDAQVETQTSPTRYRIEASQFKNPNVRTVVSGSLYALKWLYEKENPAFPHIQYTFRYSRHGRPEDVQGLAPLLSETDIYIPEAAGYGLDAYKMYTEVASGKSTPKEAIKRNAEENRAPVVLAELNMLYGTNKTIVFADADILDMLVMGDIEPLPIEEGSGIDFAKLLDSVRQTLERNAEINKGREILMLNKLGTEVRTAISRDEDLRKKNRVKVLFQLGAGHTWISQVLAQTGHDVIRRFDEQSKQYTFYSEAMRKYIFGKPVNDELVARAMLEQVFERSFRQQINTLASERVNTDGFVTYAIRAFSLDEIREMFEANRPLNYKNFGDMLIERWKAKGITFPTSKEGFYSFSRKPVKSPMQLAPAA